MKIEGSLSFNDDPGNLARTAEGARSDSADQVPGEGDSQGSDGARIMPLGTNAANHAAGSLAAARALVIQDCRLGLRGKNDSVRPTRNP
jgi:hypothetical protein